MSFFSRKREPEKPALTPAVTEDEQDVTSLTRRKEEALKRLGELQYAAATGTTSDTDARAIERLVRDIQFLDDQIKGLYEKRMRGLVTSVTSADSCSCGTLLQPSDSFCRNCGRKVARMGPDSPPGKIQCPNCKEWIRTESVFCGQCGKSLSDARPPSAGFGFQMSAHPPPAARTMPAASPPARPPADGDWAEEGPPSYAYRGGPQNPPSADKRQGWTSRLEEIAQQTPTDPVMLIRRGVALMRENRYMDAIETFEQASRMVPRDPLPRFHLGIIYVRMGDLEGAMGEFERVLRSHPTFSDAHAELGHVFLRKGKTREALDHFNQAIHHNPQHAGAHQTLGYTLLTLGDTNAARHHLEMFLRVAPNSPDARAVSDVLTRLRHATPTGEA